jgi:hypothetical protein
MKTKVTWVWYWGIDQDNLTKRSADHVFTDFDKMKEHSAKHSFEHQWIGDGYWSNYDKVETPYDEVAEARRRLGSLGLLDIWTELTGDEYDKVLNFCDPLHPSSSSSGTHVHEEIYHIGGDKYRFLYAIGERQHPRIEKSNLNE